MKVVWKVTLVSILVMIGILCGNNSFAENTTCAISWTWDTSGDLEKSITVKTNAATTIDWGDGSTESVVASSSDLTLSHTYTSAGDYTCKISDDVVTKLYCDSNQLSSIDVSGCMSLVELYCGNNELTALDVTANTSLMRLCCVQPTLNVLSLTQQQVETMNILDELESCISISSDGEIHKFANTKISVDGVVCTEHTGGTTENDGKCTVCGVKYIGVKYYVIFDNGLVRTIFSSLPGKLIRVGFTDGSAAEFMVNTGNVTLEALGNYRTFTMPSENVDITISK